MTLLSTVELRNTTTRNAAYHVDLEEVFPNYVVVVRYGAIGKGLTKKPGVPVSSLSAAIADYEAKVQAKLSGDYKHYSGNISVPTNVRQPKAQPATAKSTADAKKAPKPPSISVLAMHMKAPPPVPPAQTAWTTDDEVVYDDL